MPLWGLTTEMRRLQPWGLDEYWLAPCKVIRDPIHGDVHTTVLEQHIIDTPPFQRLRRVRQLHGCHHVYPGATHSRFAHALGTLRVAQDLMDRILSQRFGSHPVDDLFAEWDPGTPGGADATSGLAERDQFLKKVAEATVLVRLGALLHDFGHVPFSHTIEDDLRLLEPHDQNVLRMAELWDDMVAQIAERLRVRGVPHIDAVMRPLRSENGRLRRNLRPLLLRKHPSSARIRGDYPFVYDLVSDTICADLLDYLRRDHHQTGLPMALGDRFMAAFYVTPSNRGAYPMQMALLLHRNGRRRTDVDDEVLKHLRYRYELTERVYMHHAKLAGDAMLGRMLQHVADALATDPRALTVPDRASRVESVDVHTRARLADTRSARQRRLENLLLSYGDDALLEVVAASGDRQELKAASRLAQALLDRELYRHCASSSGAFAAEDLYHEYGSPDRRRELERAAAVWAGIDDPDHILLWLPPAKMRLKLAEVLVDHGRGIARFKDYSAEGSDIYAAHRRLWRIALFVHRAVSEDRQRAAAAYLAGEMDLCWDSYERELGLVPADWSATAAAFEALQTEEISDHVRALVELHRDGLVAARSGGGKLDATHTALVRRLSAVARHRGWVADAKADQVRSSGQRRDPRDG